MSLSRGAAAGGVLVSAGLWITGTCEVGVGGSRTLPRPSSTGGASHSVTTSTSSSEGRSTLVSFGGGGSEGFLTRRRITPEDNLVN